MEIDDTDYPTEMSPEVLARVLDAIRNPRVLRYLVFCPLSELLHDLLRANLNGTPDIEIYVENRVIGLITALPLLLTTTVDSFFDLSGIM
jgi:hypothetical protein